MLVFPCKLCVFPSNSNLADISFFDLMHSTYFLLHKWKSSTATHCLIRHLNNGKFNCPTIVNSILPTYNASQDWLQYKCICTINKRVTGCKYFSEVVLQGNWFWKLRYGLVNTSFLPEIQILHHVRGAICGALSDFYLSFYCSFPKFFFKSQSFC